MANLGILNGAVFYGFDVYVYNNILQGKIIFTESQIDEIHKNGFKVRNEDNNFYDSTTDRLIKRFVKYLSKMNINVDKDSFLIKEVFDKRVDKNIPYTYEPHIFGNNIKTDNVATNKEAKKLETLLVDVEHKYGLYKTTLDLEALGVGQGNKVLYGYTEDELKDSIKSYLKNLHKEFDVSFNQPKVTKDVGKLLIDVTVYNDKAIGIVNLPIDNPAQIAAEGKDKQEILNSIITQLKALNLTGKLNWGKVEDKTKKEVKKMPEMKMTAIKALQKKIAEHVKKIGINGDEIEARIYGMIPNAKPLGVGTLGGDKINLAYILPWTLDKSAIKKKKFAQEIAETHPDNVVIKEVGLTLYILDIAEDEIEVSIQADVKWINTFFGTNREDSYTIVENNIKIQDDNMVDKSAVEANADNFVMREYLKKIVGRAEVKPVVIIDKDNKIPVSFDIKNDNFDGAKVNFYHTDTELEFTAVLPLKGSFAELMTKVPKFEADLKQAGFDASTPGMAVEVHGKYGINDVSIVNDIVKLLDYVKKYKANNQVETPNSGVQDMGVVAPNNVKEPENREVERTFKTSKVKDPEHRAQLEKMRAYVKKIADVVDADNDFALRFLEEPKEFQKYKLPTVGVGLFYYGDKSIAELEQNPLYKKIYRGRGLSILRKFFKTTDLNGEKCLLVLFVDNDYAKQSKAKLIKEALENNSTVRINGRPYKVVAIYENKFAVESIAGTLYFDIDSDLINLTEE